MGLLEKLSGWLGRRGYQASVLVLGLDHAGKSSLLRALRSPDAANPAAHAVPTVAPTQDHFQSKWLALHIDFTDTSTWGLDHAGKSSLLRALRPPDAANPAAHAVPTVAPTQDHFQSKWLALHTDLSDTSTWGLDHAGKSSLLRALRSPDAANPAAHAVPTVAPTQDHFQSKWLALHIDLTDTSTWGLDHAGKSSLLRALRPPDAANPAAHAVPTVAPTQGHFQSGGVSFSAWDVSGAARHRALWERHYRRADALIFVVDAADHLRLVVAREELDLVLAHPDMSGRRLPLLVLANKSDLPRALQPAQVAAALGLERVTDKPWHVCASDALAGAGLPEGVAWLARQIRDTHAPRR